MARKHADRLEAIAELEAARDVLRLRMEEAAGDTQPMVMSQAALSPGALQRWASLMGTSDFSGQALLARRVEAMRVPQPTGAVARQQLEAQAVWHPEHPRMPAWAASVAAHRADFKDAALMFGIDESRQQVFKFLYAVQNPIYVALTPLVEDDFFPVFPTRHSDNWSGVTLQRVTFRFRCNYADLTSAAACPCIHESEMFVLLNLEHTGGTVVQTSARAIPFTDFLRNLPALERAERQAPGTREVVMVRSRDAAVLQLPWLRGLDEREGYGSHDAAPVAADTASTSTSAETALADTDIEDALLTLDVVRQHVAACGNASSDDFGTRVLGGAWTLQERGVVFDAIQGIARREFANQFCTRRGVQKPMRFDVSACGQEGRSIMARAWCHRMQYFLDLELAHGEGHVYTDAERRDYCEPSEFTMWADAVKGRALERVAQIRAVLPALA